MILGIISDSCSMALVKIWRGMITGLAQTESGLGRVGGIYFFRPLRRMFGFGLGRLVLGAMRGLRCGLSGLIPLGLGARVRRGGYLGGGRNRLGFR